MKKVFLIAATALAVVTVGACAQNGLNNNKIIITNEPVVLKKTGNTYVIPSNAAVSRDGFYYVRVNNKEKVCYPTQQPNLARLNLLVLDVNLGGTTTKWSCYDVNPNYFTIQH